MICTEDFNIPNNIVKLAEKLDNLGRMSLLVPLRLFSYHISNPWDFSPLSFGLVIGTLLFGITFTLTFYVPKLRKIFNEMESLK